MNGCHWFGGIDVLVSNAGLGLGKEFEETTLAEWRLDMSTDGRELHPRTRLRPRPVRDPHQHGCPSLTGRAELASTYPDMIGRFNQRRALAGFSTPAGIARAVSFLASEDARFATGIILPVEVGVTAGNGQPTLY